MALDLLIVLTLELHVAYVSMFIMIAKAEHRLTIFVCRHCGPPKFRRPYSQIGRFLDIYRPTKIQR